MIRVRTVLPVLLLALITVAGPRPATAEEGGGQEQPPAKKDADFRALDARTRKEVATATREYLDPARKSVYMPRKRLMQILAKLQAQGIRALADVGFLKQLAYQGRHFLPRFSSKEWRKAHADAEFKKTSGVFRNVKSERIRFTYTLPKSYPKKTALRKIPRPPPSPLLLVLHEKEDLVDHRGDSQRFPGEAALKRLYPKGKSGPLYDGWFLLAPVAARARWLEPNGNIHHRFSVSVLREFWQHYHVDFDRIVVDGNSGAAALAAAFPLVFAGVVLRGGKIIPDTVRNYASVPVFVVGDKELAKALRDAGHPDVTEGNDAQLVPWLEKRKRKIPTSFEWSVHGQDNIFANWIYVDLADFSPDAERTLKVETLDTPEDPNTIRIDARGIEELQVFLNDDILDLDREVRLVVNGVERKLGKIERSFGRLFEKDPSVRASMYFGWLYPVRIAPVRVPEAPEAKPTEEPEEPVEAKGAPADEARAGKFWSKAEAAEAKGDVETARLLYEKVVELGATSYRAKARAKIDALKPKEPVEAKGAPADEARAGKFWSKAEAAEAGGNLEKARLLYEEVVKIGATSYRARAQAKLEVLKKG
ncbi:MAG: hypothetical protein ACC662_06650 [Planctomycetota bacterium]